MTEEDLREGFAATNLAINLIPTEKDRQKFRLMVCEAFLMTLSALEAYAYQRMLLEKIQLDMHTKNSN